MCDDGSSEPQPAAAACELAKSLGGVGEAALAAVSHAPVNTATCHVTKNLTTPASSLSPAVLARIEANKHAAIQKRKAAESAASLQRHDDTAAASARSAPAAGAPSASEQHPCAAPAVKVAVSVKRHWGALGAVSDDCDD